MYLNYILIPRYGIVGASISLVISSAIPFFGYLRLLSKEYKIYNVLINHIKTLIICISLSLFGLIFEYYFNYLFMILLLVSIYIVAIYIFGIIRRDELIQLKLLFHSNVLSH